MKFVPKIINNACFACWANRVFKNNNYISLSCDTCPLKWTDRDGNPSDSCHMIYFAWRQEVGEEKKRLAKMIRDMPLKDEAKLFYNIVE